MHQALRERNLDLDLYIDLYEHPHLLLLLFLLRANNIAAPLPATQTPLLMLPGHMPVGLPSLTNDHL